MRLCLFAGTCLLASTIPALAQEGTRWTGFYAGLQAGYAFSTENDSSLSGDPNIGGPFLQTTALGSDLDGFIGGAHAGFNFQAGTVVFGIEGDISRTDLDDDDSVAVVTGGSTLATSLETDIDWLATIRGRLGYLAAPNLLVFATGGVAFGDVDQSLTFTNSGGGLGFRITNNGQSFACNANTACLAGSSSDTAVGYTVGGGLEWAIDRNWSFGAQYLFVDLGSEKVTSIGPAPNSPATFIEAEKDVELHIVTAALNYHF